MHLRVCESQMMRKSMQAGEWMMLSSKSWVNTVFLERGLSGLGGLGRISEQGSCFRVLFRVLSVFRFL